jgi:ABC-type Fe3+ transport system permease subunit
LVLAGATAILSIVLFTFVAYVVIRTRFVGRAALDFASWLPSTLPGIILGLGLLSLFSRQPAAAALLRFHGAFGSRDVDLQHDFGRADYQKRTDSVRA